MVIIMAVLMCKDTQVYSIGVGMIINHDLCPIPFTNPAQYYEWQKKRQFLKSNRIAEASLNVADTINRTISRRRLSLSDCYWVKHNNDREAVTFNYITPYLQPFIDYKLSWGTKGSAVPDATLGGSFSKTWTHLDGKSVINKINSDIFVYNEMLSLALAKKLGLPACRAWAKSHNEKPGDVFISTEEFTPDSKVEGNTIFIENISNTDLMLLPVSWIEPINAKVSKGHDVEKMTKLYTPITGGETAVDYVIRTLIFDAVVANDDRRVNLANWGYYKSANTGETKPAPLYDFNMAHHNQGTMYLSAIIDSIKARVAFKKTAEHYIEKWEEGVRGFGAQQWVKNFEAVKEALVRK